MRKKQIEVKTGCERGGCSRTELSIGFESEISIGLRAKVATFAQMNVKMGMSYEVVKAKSKPAAHCTMRVYQNNEDEDTEVDGKNINERV